MNIQEEDFRLHSYSYDLPEEQIAQFPCRTPGTSRLLVMDRQGKPGETSTEIHDSRFARLASFLPPHALVVANNTRVLPARMTGKKPGGGKVEFLLLTPLPLLLAGAKEPADGKFAKCAEVQCLFRPSGKIRIGDIITLTPCLQAVVTEKGQFGRHDARLCWNGDLEKIFEEAGSLPLPPYIRRETAQEDNDRYQTVFAKKTGAVAAPTAGLHFTPEIRASLDQEGFEWRELTLYVGYGTFSPVRAGDIRDHKMHREYVELPSDTARAIREAKAAGRPVVAVGTTSLRAMEGIAARTGKLETFNGWIDIFLYPGKNFQIVDGLITNFHLPESTLLMLVSAFAGRKRILDAYCKARELGYKFFSYGDAMLIR